MRADVIMGDYILTRTRKN